MTTSAPSPAVSMSPAALAHETQKLYEALSAAGFTRDIFIELGESVKKGTSFARLHPAVLTALARITKRMHGVP